MNSKTEQTSKKKKRESSFFYNFVKITGAIPALIWMRPKLIYKCDKKDIKLKSALICANHVDFCDAVMIYCIFWNRIVHMLATSDLYASPAKSFFFEHAKCIKVDKNNFSINGVHSVCDKLKSGKLVALFPEGRVNLHSEGAVEDFKDGAALMAYLGGAPIIPIYIKPSEKWYHRKTAVIGAPIDVRSICKNPSMPEIKRISQLLKEKICELRDSL